MPDRAAAVSSVGAGAIAEERSDEELKPAALGRSGPSEDAVTPPNGAGRVRVAEEGREFSRDDAELGREPSRVALPGRITGLLVPEVGTVPNEVRLEGECCATDNSTPSTPGVIPSVILLCVREGASVLALVGGLGSKSVAVR